jgi:uncharacterized protein
MFYISRVPTKFDRPEYRTKVQQALAENPIVAIVGPRQCGKSTLAREFLAADSSYYFDLENPLVWSLFADPMTMLQSLRGLVVIDEVQRRPDIFPVLRVLADREDQPAQFLILGSATPELRRQSAESLAGRVGLIELSGFQLAEVGIEFQDRLWLRGSFPRSFLAADEGASDRWRKNFVATFLERDLAQLGFGVQPPLMLRLWTMLSHMHGQIWNASPLASSLGISAHTVRNYLDILSQTFMIRQLQPWHSNIGKRQVKAPKIYFRDSGLLHRLLGIRTWEQLMTHPMLGASWEGWVIEEIIRRWRPEEVYFWAVHSGAELDLLMIKDGKKIGVECKRNDAPSMTRSMHIAMDDLGLDELLVLYPGTRTHALAPNISLLPVQSLAT